MQHWQLHSEMCSSQCHGSKQQHLSACVRHRQKATACVRLQSLLRNKIEGVTKGVLVYLRIVGIGYRASIEGQTITFKLGYSHDIAYDLPESMRAFLPEPTLIGLYGIDKNQVPPQPLYSLPNPAIW